MNVSECMKEHGLTDEALDEAAALLERGDFERGEGTVFIGSRLNPAGKRGMTVACDTSATQYVDVPARRKVFPGLQ